MRIAILCLGVSALALASGCQMDSNKSVASGSGPARARGMDGDEAVPLDEVPGVVKSAAAAALPGLVLDSAEAEVEDGVLIYSLSGADAEGALEVDVTADGAVLKVERGGDDGDHQPRDDDEDEEGDDEEQAIPLDQVPALVLQAAQKAVPGLIVEEAELEVENDVTVYGLEGSAAGKEVEVEVSATGQVLEVEWEEEN